MDSFPNFNTTEIQMLQLVYTEFYENHRKGNIFTIPDALQLSYKAYAAELYKKFGNTSRSYSKRTFARNNWIITNSELFYNVKNIIEREYKNGFGIKRLAKLFNSSYSTIRKFIQLLGIDINVPNKTTDSIRTFRKHKSTIERETKTGWFSPVVRRSLKIINSGRGIQGYYFNKSTNKWVWLRSSYEYIFAEYLTYNNINWDSEVVTYDLLDGTSYTPDFFIYDSNFTTITAIVEIKGYLTVNSYKVDELKKIINTEISLIGSDDIDLYKIENINYLKKWKQTRLLKLNEVE